MNESIEIFEQEKPLLMFMDDEKLSYNEYRREIETPDEVPDPSNSQVEDCECECESEFMANMPTNESYSVSEEGEERENAVAEKFLIEMGILHKVDEDEHFNLNFKSDDIIIEEVRSEGRSSVKGQNSSIAQKAQNSVRIFDNPFDDEFNPAETYQQQLEKHPLPSVVEVGSQIGSYCDINMEAMKDIEIKSKISETQVYMPSLSQISIPTVEQSSTQEVTIESDKPEVVLKSSKKKLTEFGYLLQRKGFRLMRKYYKEKFEDFGQAFDYKKRVKSITPNEMSHIMMKFIEHEFSKILPILARSELTSLLESLKQVIFSDRSNKKEPLTRGIDFGVVRNLFGKYTQKNMKVFMSESANSFLYTHFYLINGRYECYKQSDVDQSNLNDQMKKLMLTAFKGLFLTVKPIYETLYDQNSTKI
jgi:hypothetical protein